MSINEDDAFSPIVTGRADPRLTAARRRRAIETNVQEADPFRSAFGDLISAAPAAEPAEDEGVTAGDFGTVLKQGTASLGSSVAAGIEYGLRYGEEPGTPNPGADYFKVRRRALDAYAANTFDELSPAAKDRLNREILTLDPNKTLFRGGPSEFLSSVGLKVAQSLPSTAATLLPGALMLRAGLGAGAITYLGASEGALSLGSIADNIAQEIEQAPEAELLQSPYYKKLRDAGEPELQARQRLIQEAQGQAPLVGGLVVGAISAAAGRYISPVFEEGGSGKLLSRAGRGFVSEAGQEAGQSSAEQVAQNIAAQVYDNSRGTFEGAGEAGAQGALIGGVTGAGFSAALGRPKTRTALPTEEEAAPTERPATFDEVFGEAGQAPPDPRRTVQLSTGRTAQVPGYRGADIENPPEPPVDSGGQGLLDVGPVDQALQAAMNARRDGLQSDLFDQPAAEDAARAEQQGFLERPFPVTQGQLDLPEPVGTEVGTPVGGTQLNLPLRERVRGGAPVPVTPEASAQPPSDEPVPSELDLSRPVEGDPLGLAPGQRPTRSDFLKARARQQAADLTQGLRPDENQLDLFAAPPPEADAPSAEPLADLQAQLTDLADPQNERRGVFLSAANIEQLRNDGTFEQVRGVGVPIANFDGQGGTLVAKDNRTARQLLEQRKQGLPVQQIIGQATLSGTGKPADGRIVVQQRDAAGNVTRETLVSTPQEAETTRASFETEGRTGVILSAVEAIRRRNQRIREESRQATASTDARAVRRRAETVLEEELGEGPALDTARRKIGRRPLSDNEAARKLLNYAARQRKRELRGRLGDQDAPANLDFADLKVAQQYQQLFGEYRDAQIAEQLATTAEATREASARAEGLRRQLGAIRRTSKATTPSEKLARAARRISREESEKVAREARENPSPRRRAPRTEGDILSGATRTALERATPEQLDSMSDTEVNLLFVEAANIASGLKTSVARNTSSSATAAEANAGKPVEASGQGFEQLVANNPTRSQKLKLINRVKRYLTRQRMGGKVRTSQITARATARKTATGERQSVRRGTFDPNKALDLNPPREMSATDQAKYNERVSKSYEALDTATAKLVMIDNSAQGFGLEVERDTNGNPTEGARNAVYGRTYLRTLVQYGRVLSKLRPLSRGALNEVERFTRIANELANTRADKLAAKLAQLTEAEASAQAAAAVRVDPQNLGRLSEPAQRQATALAQNAKVREKIAAARRLHEVWKNNSKYEQFVAPLMQKLIGYVTRDTSLANLAVERRGLGYVPTFAEMRNLRYALNDFQQTDRENLYKPLKRWFEEYGFKFDDKGALVLARNAAQFEYVNETQLLRKARDASGFRNAPLNYKQKLALEKQRRKQALIDKERARRAKLSPRQRAREDRSLANKIEKDRRKGMSYLQRRALEALDMRSTQYRMSAMDLAADVPATRASVEGLADLLESQGDAPVRLTDALQVIGSNLPADHPYQTLIQRLSNIGLADVAVRWGETPAGTLGVFQTVGATLPDGTRVTDRIIRLNRQTLENLRSRGIDPAPALLHTFLHEAVHAATVGAIYNNPAIRLGITELLGDIRRLADTQGISLNSRTGNEFYGVRGNDPAEFIAEAFTNTEFQQLLRTIQYDRNENIFQRFLRLVRRVLGLSDSPSDRNILDIVMFNAEELFTGEVENIRTKGAESSYAMTAGAVGGVVGDVIDKIMQSSRVARSVRDKAANTLERNKEGGTRLLLSALTMEQIRDFYNRSFGGSGGPLAEYMKAYFRRNADASANREVPDKLSRRWTKLGETKPAETLEMSKLMTEATLYGIAPDATLTAAINSGVKSQDQIQRYRDLQRRYRALPADVKQLYQEVQRYYSETLQREVNLMTLSALRGVLGAANFNVTEADIQRLRLNTVQGLEQRFGNALAPEERKTIASIAALPQQRQGPYFPLQRFGDYAVTAERTVATRSFADATAARAYAQSQRESDPTLSVSFPTQTANGWTVTVKEKDVRFRETVSEAEAARQEMIQQYGAGAVDQQVQLKTQLFSRDAAISSNSGLQTILGKLEGNPAAQAAIKDFYLRSLADSSFRKRETRRANRRGVNYEQQQRTFRNYARSAAYYTAQLRFGWQLADELARMNTYARDVARGSKQSDVSSVRLSEVVQEIGARDRMTASPYQMNKVAQKATELTQFMLLASPSYSMVNATQPYMITLPWMAARSSVGDATAALLHAQRLIAAPVLNQAVSSAGGLRALVSRSAAERAFSVLEQVEDHIKQRGGARSSEYIDLLNKLKREDIIDFTLITELRDTAQGADTGLTARVLDASRIMGHLTEVNNRIVTALAAYDLYRNKGQSVQAATGFAQQAVSLTQFNYSSGNSPRLFNARGPLGAMGPLVFQFMKYPQHIYALLIDNFRSAVGRGEINRTVAIKTLAGLFTTHLAAAGVVGAMLQPIKWAIGLFLAAFGDDDEPYTIANALSGETFDRLARKANTAMFGSDLGEIFSAGLPRAFGADLSNRLSLGSLYMIDLRTDTTESTLGSILEAFGGPTVSVAGSALRGAQLMHEGQIDKGLEQFMPKGAKDLLQAVRFSQQGLTDASGKEIIGAKDMKPWQLFLKSIGFQPGAVAEAYARRGAINEARQYDRDRRLILLKRIQREQDPQERLKIMDEIREFNRANPEAFINRSQIIQSIQRFREQSVRSGRLGAALRDRELAYAEEGDPYNYGNEEDDE